MNIQKYEAFLKIIELGSLTKAAEVFGATQSAMSQILNSLEKEWKVNLLIRDRNGVRPTSEAEKLIPYIKSVCDSNRDLVSEVGELHGLRSGLIKIATVTSMAQHRLPAMIRNFKAEYPNIDFQLHHGAFHSDVENMVSDGVVDFGFTSLPPRQDLVAIPLEKDELMVVLHGNHPLSKVDKFPVEQLLNYDFILPAQEAEKDVFACLQEYGIKPRARYTSWDAYSIIAMVESELGISILPELLLHRTPYGVLWKSLDRPYYRQMGVVIRDINKISTVARKFLECINADLNTK